MFSNVLREFIEGMRTTGLLEYIAVFSGILSVWFSKREHILVYPVGLINTVIYVYLSFKYHLLGEAVVNFYYTVMSLYGWVLWSKRDETKNAAVKIRFSTSKERAVQALFFLLLYGLFYFSLVYLKKEFYEGAIPWADAFASATAFTGMWLMAKKKVESWWWWIATNIASIPLYFVKGLVFTSVYYFVLLLLAFAGWAAWRKKAFHPETHSSTV
jgi:nicotinamide mononucleotide transporter